MFVNSSLIFGRSKTLPTMLINCQVNANDNYCALKGLSRVNYLKHTLQIVAVIERLTENCGELQVQLKDAFLKLDKVVLEGWIIWFQDIVGLCRKLSEAGVEF